MHLNRNTYLNIKSYMYLHKKQTVTDVLGMLSDIRVRYTAYDNKTVKENPTFSPESTGSLNTKGINKAIRAIGNSVFTI